ncbi:unnamed protein product [Symbiodinium natans]|uniref:Uncharacterized protein n=1 Tax=Symbiodinium natans TaxID=878477 RepID=A0A812QNV5_9DINO|nr:unnamed protein product [Symbiodinium natans]
MKTCAAFRNCFLVDGLRPCSLKSPVIDCSGRRQLAKVALYIMFYYEGAHVGFRAVCDDLFSSTLVCIQAEFDCRAAAAELHCMPPDWHPQPKIPQALGSNAPAHNR